MRYLLCFLLLLGACTSKEIQYKAETELAHESCRDTYLSLTSEVTAMQENLVRAEHELAVTKTRVHSLRREYFRKKTTLIMLRVERFEDEIASKRRNPKQFVHFLEHHLVGLFESEREDLALIIDMDEDFSRDGQRTLDKILRLITNLNEEKELY